LAKAPRKLRRPLVEQPHAVAVVAQQAGEAAAGVAVVVAEVAVTLLRPNRLRDGPMEESC
jgi:hypothetical protein